MNVYTKAGGGGRELIPPPPLADQPLSPGLQL